MRRSCPGCNRRSFRRRRRAGWSRAILAFRVDSRRRNGITSRRALESHSRRVSRTVSAERYSAVRVRPASALHSGSTTRRSKTCTCSTKLATRLTACTGRASCRRPFEEPFRTRSDGSSQGQRFPFVLPTPGDPANKTLDYSVFLPIQGSPGYSIHNTVPYAEHYNFSIQRSFGKHGDDAGICRYARTPADCTNGIKPRRSGSCVLSLRGSGVLAGTSTMRSGGELGVYTRPDGTIVNGTRGPLGPDFGSNSYTANIANSNYNALSGNPRTQSGRSDLPCRVHFR